MVTWRGHTGWIMDRDGRVRVGATDVSTGGYTQKALLVMSATMDLYPRQVGRANSTDSTMTSSTGAINKE